MSQKKMNYQENEFGRFWYPIIDDKRVAKDLISLITDDCFMTLAISTADSHVAISLANSWTLGGYSLEQIIRQNGMFRTKHLNFIRSIYLIDKLSYVNLPMVNYGAMSYFLIFSKDKKPVTQQIVDLILLENSQAHGKKWIEWVKQVIDTLGCECVGATDEDCSEIQFVGNQHSIRNILNVVKTEKSPFKQN